MSKSASHRACGYFLALSPMAMLVAGAAVGMPWFVFAFFFCVLPVVRMFLPDDPAEPQDIEQVSRLHFAILKCIPMIHVLLWAAVLPWAMFEIPGLHPGQLVCFALSFWVVTSLNLTIAHELLHSTRLVAAACRKTSGRKHRLLPDAGGTPASPHSCGQ